MTDYDCDRVARALGEPEWPYIDHDDDIRPLRGCCLSCHDGEDPIPATVLFRGLTVVVCCEGQAHPALTEPPREADE